MIQGHLFFSILALVVMEELLRKLDLRPEWDEIRSDLDALHGSEVEHKGKRYLLRSSLPGVSGRILLDSARI
jgi:hypothetical protein